MYITTGGMVRAHLLPDGTRVHRVLYLIALTPKGLVVILSQRYFSPGAVLIVRRDDPPCSAVVPSRIILF
jgi:hypothetical protein